MRIIKSIPPWSRALLWTNSWTCSTAKTIHSVYSSSRAGQINPWSGSWSHDKALSTTAWREYR